MMLILLMSILIIVLTLLAVIHSRSEHVKLGNKIPGPKAWPLFGNLFNFPLFGSDALAAFDDAHRRYGSTFRLWIGNHLMVIISDPQDLQMLLTSNTLITKSISYKLLQSWLGTGLLISTGLLWQRRRKAITPTFHFKVLEDFVPVFNRCANTLVQQLQKVANGETFVASGFLANCALDTVAETAMGTRIHAQENPKSEYVLSIQRLSKILSKKISNPLLGVEPIYTLSRMKAAELKELSTVNALPLKVIEEKERCFLSPDGLHKAPIDQDAFGMKKRTAFLELLLKMKKDKNLAFTTDADIMDEVTTFMFEGHDTTSSALSFVLYFLGTHPHVQKEVYEEVSEILRKGEPHQEQLNEMKYLERVIKESLRIHPAVPGIGRQIHCKTVLPSSGLVVPPGTSLVASIQRVHNREDLYPEPARFDPDRFLPEIQAARHPFSYIPFSAGPRNCIGQKFAMLDIKAIISKVVYKFEISADSELVISPHLITRIHDGPKLRLRERDR